MQPQAQFNDLEVEYSTKQSKVYEDLDQTDDVRFETFELRYPYINSTYRDLTPHQIQMGRPFHNVSDIVQQYKFKNVNSVRIVVLGQSKHSNFDLGIQLSLFSTYSQNLMEKYQKSIAVGLLLIFLMYCGLLVRNYRRKMDDKKYQEFDDEGYGDEEIKE